KSYSNEKVATRLARPVLESRPLADARGSDRSRDRQGAVGQLLVTLCLTFAATALAQPSLRDFELRASAARARGDAAEALSVWEQAAASDPRSARVQDEIGFLLAVLNRREEAVAHFESAL